MGMDRTTTDTDMIGTVVITNSDDMQFLERLIPQALKFSDRVSVAVGTRRWDGQLEDMDRIRAFVAAWSAPPQIVFTMYDPIDEAAACQHAALVKDVRMLPEAYARHVALMAMPGHECLDYVLYLDSDEIVEGPSFAQWLNTGVHTQYDVLKLACHWYWRLPTLRAHDYLEDSIVLIRRGLVTPQLVFSDLARTAFYDAPSTPRKVRMVVGPDGLPFVHHFSWCRTHRQMLQKVATWGHRDVAYIALVDEEFSRPFNGTDFLRGLRYDVVPNAFDIVMIDTTFRSVPILCGM